MSMQVVKNRGIKESYPDIHPERGRFELGRYYPPTIERKEYLNARIIEAIKDDFSEYKPLNNSQLNHLDRIDTFDYYPLDMHKAVELFLSYYGDGILDIIHGFRSPLVYGINAHNAGLAIDIAAADKTHARKITNAAFRAGIPNIVLGGDFEESQGYVHLDISPKEIFLYNAGIYEGPWS